MSKQLEFVHVLKSIARNKQMKASLMNSKELSPLLLRAAQRFITGEKRNDGLLIAKQLIEKGYFISLEYIGENTTTLENSEQAKNEFLQLIEEMGAQSMKETVSFDLSHIGLNVDEETAYRHLIELVEKAQKYNMTLMVSMEEAARTDEILAIYKQIASQYENVGITIQAYLPRSIHDLNELLHYPGKIRLVKGAYQEPAHVTLSRSSELNHRYLQLAEQVIKAERSLSIATHDELLLAECEKQKFLQLPNVQTEMLYGIHPDLLKRLKSKGYQTSTYLIYGNDWYLYLCHRIAEYPENLYQAMIDLMNPSPIKECERY